MYLLGANQSIEIVLAGAKTANDCEYTTLAITTGDVLECSNGVTNGSTPVTAIAAASGLVRHISVFNADTVASIVTVRVKDTNSGTVYRRLVTWTLAAGSSLFFDSESGWSVRDSSGREQVLTTASGAPLSSGKLWLGNGSNLAAEVSMSGYATITNAGVVTVSKVLGSDGTSNATAGDVGEQVAASAQALSIPGASGEYGDACSITLSAGDWDISAVAVMGGNGATVTGSSFGVGTASGNSGTGLVNGDTYMSFPPPSSSSQSGSALAGIRVKPAASTTYYLKVIGYYSGGSPNVWGRMAARRIR